MDSFEDVDDGETPIIDPYEELGIERTATADQVKAAYRKCALKHHPDKVPDDQKSQATERFQAIAFAYAILSDLARRARYDTTGSTSESIVDSDGFSWSDFYREQYADAVSAANIAKFAAKYKGSEEEKDDLLVAYEKFKGNMEMIHETVMLSDVLEDDERFRAIIDAAIEAGDLPSFPAYTGESKQSKKDRRKRANRERQEAEDYAKELGVHDKLFGGSDANDDKKNGDAGRGAKGRSKGPKKDDKSSEDALAALIRKRQSDRGSDFLDRLAEKYGAAPSKKKGKKKAADDEEDDEGDEPSEEAFQATAARLNKRKADADKARASKKSKR